MKSTGIVLVALLGLTIGKPAPMSARQFTADVPVAERDILSAFYAATGGPSWTRRDGWGTASSVCHWFGVSCNFVDGDEKRPFVAHLSLPANNLTGRIPDSLGYLTGLASLDVWGNRLVGSVPERILHSWDIHQLDLAAEGNRFTDFATKVTIESESFGTLCSPVGEAHYRIVLDASKNHATYQSILCASPGSRETYCRVREGVPLSLARFSRALAGLRFGSFAASYEYPGLRTTTHGTDLTTTAEWLDQPAQSVRTYNRQGPRDVWIAQQLFLGLIADIFWEKETRTARCDFER